MEQKQKQFEIPTLNPEDIEVKVKQINQNGALALLYKTARTDMEYLDKFIGPNNWQCEYEEIKGNLYCTISIWDDEKKQWIKKQDCGIESREDDEGNQKKGEASDAFKRASTKAASIGRELYSSPFIWLSVQTENKNGRYQLADRFAKFAVSEIGYDAKRKINKLVIVNERTKEVVYKFGVATTTASAKTTNKQQAPQKQSQKEPDEKTGTELENKVKAVVTTATKVPSDAPKHKAIYENFITRHKIDGNKFIEMRASAVRAGKNVTDKSFKELTADEWIALIAAMETLYTEGFFKDVA